MNDPLDLNLAKRPFTNDGPLWLGLGLLAAGVLALAAWNGAQFMATGAQVRALSEQREALQGKRRAASRREQGLLRTIEAARSELLASRATFANTIIKAHSFSWTRLFNELEKVMPLGARLVNIRPRVDDGIRIRINGVARDAASFWELQDNLEKWPVFGNVYPDAVQPTAARSGIMTGELLFSLETEYFPDARLLLGLDEDEPGLVDAASAEPAPAAAAEAQDEEQPATEQAQNADAEPATAPPPPGPAAPGLERMSRRDRQALRQHKTPPQRGGVQRLTPPAEGTPGQPKPASGFVRPPKPEGGRLLPSVSVAGRNEAGQPIDENGNVISVEDVLNRPAGIKPGAPAAAAAGEDGKPDDKAAAGRKGEDKKK